MRTTKPRGGKQPAKRKIAFTAKAKARVSARDVAPVTPTLKQVQESINKGTTYALSEFRKLVGY